MTPSAILEMFSLKVNGPVNEELIRKFTELEFSDTFFQIGSLKASVPNGFPMRFFHGN